MTERERRPPWPRRSASTVNLRIPRVDWPAITAGTKTELRTTGRGASLAYVHPPIPVVGFTIWDHQAPTSRLLVLEELGSEPLGSISAASLEREGFASFGEFRRYWRTYRTREAFKPLTTVWVHRLRVFTPDDVEPSARRLFNHLYGAHAPR